jgi:hypothetical protein
LKAFPTHKDALSFEKGMDLRDWFAGLAMQIFIADAKGFNSNDLVKFSYQLADLMMKERDATNK